MRVTGAIIVSFWLGILCQTVRAQNYIVTQVGTVQGALVSNGAQPPTFNWQIPDVTFPQEFGSIPNVIVSFSSVFPVSEPTSSRGASFVDIQATNITTKGFKPVISSPIEGIGLNTHPLTVSWTAVGQLLLN